MGAACEFNLYNSRVSFQICNMATTPTLTRVAHHIRFGSQLMFVQWMPLRRWLGCPHRHGLLPVALFCGYLFLLVASSFTLLVTLKICLMNIQQKRIYARYSLAVDQERSWVNCTYNDRILTFVLVWYRMFRIWGFYFSDHPDIHSTLKGNTRTISTFQTIKSIMIFVRKHLGVFKTCIQTFINAGQLFCT